MFSWLRTHKHTILMYGWIIMVPVTLITDLKTSVTFIVFMSLYANIEASAAARESAKQRRYN